MFVLRICLQMKKLVACSHSFVPCYSLNAAERTSLFYSCNILSSFLEKIRAELKVKTKLIHIKFNCVTWKAEQFARSYAFSNFQEKSFIVDVISSYNLIGIFDDKYISWYNVFWILLKLIVSMNWNFAANKTFYTKIYLSNNL